MFSERSVPFPKAPQEDLRDNNRTICSGKLTLRWVILRTRRSSSLLCLWVAQDVSCSCLGKFLGQLEVAFAIHNDKMGSIFPRGNEMHQYLSSETFLNVREQWKYTSKKLPWVISSVKSASVLKHNNYSRITIFKYKENFCLCILMTTNKEKPTKESVHLFIFINMWQ